MFYYLTELNVSLTIVGLLIYKRFPEARIMTCILTSWSKIMFPEQSEVIFAERSKVMFAEWSEVIFAEWSKFTEKII